MWLLYFIGDSTLLDEIKSEIMRFSCDKDEESAVGIIM